ncbi:MAG: hypothetical protein KDD78_20330 [Caldilineaceae bacterium]|nr:hypothetical protein [Caldilineaceae bacterium]
MDLSTSIHLHSQRHGRARSKALPRLPLLLPILLIVLAGLLLTGCGRKELPIATVVASPTAAPVETPSPDVATMPAATSVAESLTPIQVTVVLTDALGPSDVVASAAVDVSAMVTQTPVAVEETIDCALESDLDLAGYPNLEAEMGCALGSALTGAVGFNEFGPGPDYTKFMVWLSWEGNIYVLLPDGTWEAFPDTWTEEMPTFACNPLGGEPTSPPLPRRGFGKLWCENATIRDAMGTIEVEERLCQHAVTQEFETGRVIGCFEDATIRYYKLFNNQTWEAVVQP